MTSLTTNDCFADVEPEGSWSRRRGKLSGFAVPSRANEAAFNQAVDDVAHAARSLIAGLVSHSGPRNRDVEAAKARARSAERFAPRGDPAG